MAIVAPRRHLVRFLLVVMTLSIVQCYTLRSNLVQSVRCSLGRGLSTAPAKSSASLEVDVQPVLSSSVKIKRKPSKSALSSLCIDGSSTEVDVAKATSTKGKAKPQSSVQQGRSLHSSDDCIAFEIFGEPIALQRHRTLKTGVVFNPSSKQQKQFLESARPYLPSSPFEGPLEARLVFFFRRPLNHYGTGRNSNTLKMGMDVWHDKKKDVDNLVKFVLDSLNKEAYVDDGQVAVLSAGKLYTEGPERVAVHLRKLKDTDALFGDHFAAESEAAAR